MSEHQGIERVTVSLPTELLNVLDELGKNLGHKSRSETVRTATRDYISEHRWGEKEGWRVGVIMIQYDNNQASAIQKINYCRGKFRNLIKSSLAVPTSKDDTMEILAIQGEANKINELIDETKSIRRIKNLRWLITRCGRSIP